MTKSIIWQQNIRSPFLNIKILPILVLVIYINYISD
jgi:hypothetical protein